MYKLIWIGYIWNFKSYIFLFLILISQTPNFKSKLTLFQEQKPSSVNQKFIYF